jgi:titin
VNLSISGGSGNGLVSFAITGGTATGCLISGNSLTASTGGTCHVRAIKATDATYLSAQSAVVTITMLSPALVPTFSAPAAIDGGFTVKLTNFDKRYVWEFSASGATVTRGAVSGATMLITVTGLGAGSSVELKAVTTRPGYASGSANVTGSALKRLDEIEFSELSSMAGGITLTILNYDAAVNYDVKVSRGKLVKTVSNSSSLVLKVTSLTAGSLTTVTVNAVRSGYVTRSAVISGAALKAALVPSVKSVIAGSKKLVVTIGNYNSSFDWIVTASSGIVSRTSISGGVATYTVSNLSTGKLVTISIKTCSCECFRTPSIWVIGICVFSGL